MRKWKITVGQLTPIQLDCMTNAKRACEILRECAAVGSNLLVLPELYLTGYEIADTLAAPLKKKLLKQRVTQALELLQRQTKETGVDIIISYPLFSPGHEKPFIALQYFSQGISLALHKKINLCNYAQYTEHLTFTAGDEISVARTGSGMAGLFVCEDLWHVTNAIFAAKAGAEVLFYPSAATVLKKGDGENYLSNWKMITASTAFTQTSFVVCCNQAVSDTALYFGGSHIVTPDGEILVQLPLFEEKLVHAELDMSYLENVRKTRPLLKNERFEVYKKLV